MFYIHNQNDILASHINSGTSTCFVSNNMLLDLGKCSVLGNLALKMALCHSQKINGVLRRQCCRMTIYHQDLTKPN